jgi:hypothetical protein
MIHFPNVSTKIPTVQNRLELGFLPPEIQPTFQPAQFNPEAPVFNVAYDIEKANEQKRLPKTLKEAYEVLDMIIGEKSSKNRVVFSLPEIKQIAKNLDLSPTGNKTEVSRRIRQAVEKYFSINKNL